MNSLKHDAPDNIDNHLGRCLKNWVSTKHPPSDARGRLLETASRQAAQQYEKPSPFAFLSRREFQDDLFLTLSRSYGYTLQIGVMIR